MKLKSLLIVLCAALAFVACDDETGSLGSSLTSNMDHLEISTDTFTLKTRSIAIDSVLAKSSVSLLGSIRDPETGEYISANYMTQFHTLENYALPSLDSIVSRDENGQVIADSCEIRMFFQKFYGDSLTSMKCTVYELEKPMKEDKTYYSNFDPKAEGFIREGGLTAKKTYTLEDMSVAEGTRNDEEYTKNIRVSLNEPYTDKNGVTYNNYGTYVMRKYYEDPSNFKNSIKMTNNVIPGFYIESTGGLGSMAYIDITQLNIYFTYKGISSDKPYTGTTSFAGTQEVLQKTNYVNEKDAIKKLAADQTCTYLKAPAGIFTEIEIPVDEICKGHDNDTINSAKFVLQRLANKVESDYSFEPPTSILLLPKDSLYSFFEHNKIANYKTSFIATYDSGKKTYSFNNIGSLVKAMQQAKLNGETSADWNKAVLVPVSTRTSNINGQNVVTKIYNEMDLKCTRLVGGDDNPNDAIKISVIYSKYE